MYSRYWGDDGIGNKVTTTAPSLDWLHRVARKRAAERSSRGESDAAETDENVRLKKVQKQGMLHDAEKQSPGSEKEKESKKKKKKQKVHESLELKGSTNVCIGKSGLHSKALHWEEEKEDAATREERGMVLQQHTTRTDRDITGTVTCTDSATNSTREELHGKASYKEKKESHEEGREGIDKSDKDISTSEEETLTLLTREAKSVPKGRTCRQLPDWILQPEVIETDIQQYSQPLDDFELPSVIVKNLRQMKISKLFPVQVQIY